MKARALTPFLSPLLVAGIASAVVVPACSDPVHDQQVSSLGPENPQIPKGQYHRAGQPCTVCHGPEGPAQTEFAIAGTIFWQPYQSANGQNQSSIGANSAIVSVVDSLGVPIQIQTNCVGNFWVTPAAYNPAYPIKVSVYAEGTTYTDVMFTQISRTGACATCHSDPANYNAVGHIYLTSGAIPQSELNVTCPADPNLADFGGGIP